MNKLLFIVAALLFVACKNDKKADNTPKDIKKEWVLNHAKGFSITDYGMYKTLTINTPWADAKTAFKYAIVSKSTANQINLNTTNYDGIITTPITKSIATATTHIGFMTALNTEETLVGFPNTDYISSKNVRKSIAEGLVTDLGTYEDLNTELVLALQPQVIFAFGLNAANKALATVQNANIPVIYIGEWVEASPLGKTEWLKVFGVLFNKEKQADSIFNTIEKNYLAAKNLAKKASKQPTVLSGGMYKDVWYLPKGTNYKAQLLRDANTHYLWQNTTGNGSLELNFETVFNTAKEAEFWFNPFSITSYNELKQANIHYTKFSAYKNKKIYSFAGTTGETGGKLYYETGTLRPDIVLKDIIKICHPQLLPEHQLYFYKKLN